LKLAIVNLTSGGLSGGYRKYLQKIIPIFQMHQNIDSILLYLHHNVIDLIKESSNMKVISIKDSMSGKERIIENVYSNSADVVFIPTARWIGFGSIPTVIMVRNMEPLMYPFQGNPLTEAIKNLLRNYVAHRSCLRATKIIAVSEFVKDYIIKKWAIDPMKIGVIYHGIDRPHSLNGKGGPVEIPPERRIDFLFTAGSIRPARGLEDIISALGELKKRGVSKNIIIAGGVDPTAKSYKEKIDIITEKSGIKDQIFWAGHLGEEKMSWCYQNCSAFIMTSRVEACPNIALEAMANGSLCISTTAQPMPEFFTDASLYYSPENISTLVDRILEIQTMEEDKRVKLRSRALERSLDFTWELCAEKTLAFLRSAAP
jgi:glycosyltransferase involved in cell wall biosynthesis